MIEAFNYNVKQFNFAKILRDIFGLEHLCLAHLKDNNYGQFTSPGKDQGTNFHKTYYEKCVENSEFHNLYKQFLVEICPLFNRDTEEFIFQRIPTFRVQLPNNFAVGEFHRDRDYQHFPFETNVFLPLTPAFDTNTIWLETEEGAEDYSPLNCNYGTIVVFDGANLKHGNYPNNTGLTRMSVDFRLIPKELYYDRQETTVASHTKLDKEHYYMELTCE